MSYLNLDNRNKYEKIIRELELLYRLDSSRETKGEFFGYFVFNALAKFIQPNHMLSTNIFNANNFSVDQKKRLDTSLTLLFGETNSLHHMDAVDHFAYVISAIYWGYCGQMDPQPQSSLGMRCYLSGVLTSVRMMLANQRSDIPNPANNLMVTRRYMIIDGLINHLILESYHANDRQVNDSQRRSNGDIWVGGNLCLPEEDTRQPHEKLTRP